LATRIRLPVGRGSPMVGQLFHNFQRQAEG
jgi:hypothetical protein